MSAVPRAQWFSDDNSKPFNALAAIAKRAAVHRRHQPSLLQTEAIKKASAEYRREFGGAERSRKKRNNSPPCKSPRTQVSPSNPSMKSYCRRPRGSVKHRALKSTGKSKGRGKRSKKSASKKSKSSSRSKSAKRSGKSGKSHPGKGGQRPAKMSGNRKAELAAQALKSKK